ncbi:helix-turn-helix domain-containing protein [Streptomyces sp. 8K308]|uniref:GlxA family transcriptional regulator n=1 Tax=Streptomyces sp. 8K308 TaxID=2530388 RepID=UPI00104D3A53|nr:helix-turn-helix domain-containing protein [Streptomyces sp. 8K308]TDC13424.1 helix-turn-helix domain-containing protein [Streptomyces sp. 8K308]
MAVHRVAVLALHRVVPFDLGIPTLVFAQRPSTPYRMTLCAENPGEVTTATGFTVRVDGGLTVARRADTIIVPGYALQSRPTQEVLSLLARAHDRGKRIVSICTGAFALAAAGVLDGRQATTHWRHADRLAEEYPQVLVNRDVLYVDEGTVLTSAGVAAGIDLCLHIVRTDLGSRIANDLARDIIAAPHRSGGQSQFIQRIVPPERGISLAATRAWALSRLQRPLTVADLARHAGVSERTLARRFVAETGMSALQWLLAARIDLARELLERGDLSIEQIADRCGIGTTANLRTHFRRLVGTSPADYRRTFASA